MKPDKAPARAPRRVYPGELKKEAAPMLLGGHSAPSVARNLGIRHAPLLYRWKAGALGQQARSPRPRRPGCGNSRSRSGAPSASATS
jgi:transposase-like protein